MSRKLFIGIVSGLLIGLLYITLKKYTESYKFFLFPFNIKKDTKKHFLPARTSIRPFILPLKKYDYEKELPRLIKYKNRLLVPVGDQGECGGCWAFSIADTLADRTMVFSAGQFRKRLSAQAILSCIEFPDGCEGGFLDRSCEWLAENEYPVPLESKLPYQQEYGGLIKTSCLNKENLLGILIKKGTVKSVTTYIPETEYDPEILKENIKNMKTELARSGPIFCAMTVYMDIYDYDGNYVYTHSPSAAFVGGHAIEIVGYCEKGEDPRENFKDTGYWICRNSWGPEFPKKKSIYGKGYFTIRMGRNECGVESRCGIMDPDIENKSTEKDLRKLRYESWSQFEKEMNLQSV